MSFISVSTNHINYSATCLARTVVVGAWQSVSFSLLALSAVLLGNVKDDDEKRCSGRQDALENMERLVNDAAAAALVVVFFCVLVFRPEW